MKNNKMLFVKHNTKLFILSEHTRIAFEKRVLYNTTKSVSKTYYTLKKDDFLNIESAQIRNTQNA